MIEKLIINLKRKSETKLDKLILANCPSNLSLSRTKIQELIKNKKVFEPKYHTPLTLKNKTDKLKQVVLYCENILNRNIYPQKLNVPIIFEDEYLAVFNKPSNMVVHPTQFSQRNTLVNFLIFRYRDTLPIVYDELRPGIVHRLDKDTSGLIVVAKNKFCAESLVSQFKGRKVKKVYSALCIGNPLENLSKIVCKQGISVLENDIIEVKTLIGRNKNNREIMDANFDHGKSAISRFSVCAVYKLSEYDTLSLISCEIETGRTHQIRAHARFIGHPIFGDKLYKIGKKLDTSVQGALSSLGNTGIERQMLHASKLTIAHPMNEESLSLKCNLPADFTDLLSSLRNKEIN